jgi:hypothetical protein
MVDRLVYRFRLGNIGFQRVDFFYCHQDLDLGRCLPQRESLPVHYMSVGIILTNICWSLGSFLSF